VVTESRSTVDVGNCKNRTCWIGFRRSRECSKMDRALHSVKCDDGRQSDSSIVCIEPGDLNFKVISQAEPTHNFERERRSKMQ
jgi:hypothetical protein